MARANKNQSKNNKKVVKPTTDVTEKVTIAVKEETPQGEWFFRIVLIVMLVGLLAVSVYFFVDWIIKMNQKEEEATTRFHENNYITLADLELLLNNENFDFSMLSNKAFGAALDKTVFKEDSTVDIRYVYVYFFAENTDYLTGNAVDLQINGTDPVIDQIMEHAVIHTVPRDREMEFMAVDDMAFFFLDISNPVNSDWATVVGNHANVTFNILPPMLLEIYDGMHEDPNDLTWLQQFTNQRRAQEKLEAILAALDPEDEDN